jgi:glycerol-3-phosphate dehydrogenase (NAD(P)+)
MKLAVIGAGAWGTALAISLAGRHSVTLVARDASHAADINQARENVRYLPGCSLPAQIIVQAGDCSLATADLVIIATPVAGLRQALAGLAVQAPRLPFLWVCKGLEAETGTVAAPGGDRGARRPE